MLKLSGYRYDVTVHVDTLFDANAEMSKWIPAFSLSVDRLGGQCVLVRFGEKAWSFGRHLFSLNVNYQK